MPLTVASMDRPSALTAIAQKRGMVACVCAAPSGEAIPLTSPSASKIEHQVARTTPMEHLVIFTDARPSTQVWQWVKREAGRPTACREHSYHRNQPGHGRRFKSCRPWKFPREEESLTILDAAGKAKAAFDVDKITKRFYDRFQKEHAAFLKFIRASLPGEPGMVCLVDAESVDVRLLHSEEGIPGR